MRPRNRVAEENAAGTLRESRWESSTKPRTKPRGKDRTGGKDFRACIFTNQRKCAITRRSGSSTFRAFRTPAFARRAPFLFAPLVVSSLLQALHRGSLHLTTRIERVNRYEAQAARELLKNYDALTATSFAILSRAGRYLPQQRASLGQDALDRQTPRKKCRSISIASSNTRALSFTRASSPQMNAQRKLVYPRNAIPSRRVPCSNIQDPSINPR